MPHDRVQDVRPLPSHTLADRPLTCPHESRLKKSNPFYDAIIDEHLSALKEDLVGYSDPETGHFVFTAKYLAERGVCCGSGCRHCPYEA